MLPDLEAIDWSAYEHAYGKADDVPKMLRGMLDPEQQDGAFGSFDSAVNHQGWATPAAVPCMPWLVAALDHPDVPLARLVVLLADLSIGGSHENWLGQRFDVAADASLHDPVLERHARFVELLDHEEADVRAAAALALAVLPEESQAALPALRSRVASERKGDARASAVLALGILGGPEDVSLLDQVLAKRVSKALATAVRCARVWIAPGQLSDDDLLELLSEAVGKRRARGLPWADGDIARLAEQVVIWALTSHVESDRLLDLLELLDGAILKRVVGALVDRAFPKDSPELEAADALTPPQRAALLAASAVDRSVLSGWIGDRLRDVAVPRTARSLRVYLGLDPSRLMDRSVRLDGIERPLWRWIREAVRNRVDRSAVAEAVVATLTPEETWVAALELNDDKYHYADVVVATAKARYAHEHDALVPRGFARVVAVVAELLRPHGDRFREEIEARLDALLAESHPHRSDTTLWLLVRARVGPLPQKWDPLVVRRVTAPPENRAPALIVEVLRAVPSDRREAIVLSAPLTAWGGSTLTLDNGQTFSWKAIWAPDGWWYLPACPTPGILSAVVRAIKDWSNLPAPPEDTPKGFYVHPHAPFPFARARELFAEFDSAVVLATLEPLLGEPDYDRELVTRLLDLAG